MKKLLILFAAGFPYNISEPFLEQEYPLYPDYFDQVLLITSCKRGEMPTRSLNDSNITVLRDHTVHGDLLHILSALPRTLTDPMLYRELRLLLGKKQFSFAKLREMLVFSLCANHRVKLALRWLRKHPDCAPAAIYSYWLHIPAYAAVRLKQRLKGNCFTVSRAHGFDLYLERRESCYIPYHNQVFDALDEVASISEDGQHYLQTHYGHSEKVCVHRLGASDYGCHNPCVGRRTLRIVTCARTIPLKRLDRLVDALRQIPDRAIHWTHIGSGEAQENLERYAASQLPPNITAEFTGRIPNAQIYETYRSQPFHVFVNLSESEGAPVSIMEAMSFDIPAIATAVGGTPELIEDGRNGFLLEKDFSDRQLIDLILKVMDMTDDDYQNLRAAAREKYKQHYDAEANHRQFLQKLSAH